MMQPLKTINRLNLPDLSGNSVLNLGGEGGGAVDLKEVHAKKYGFKGGAGGEGGLTKRILSSFAVMVSVGSGAALLKANI